MQVSPARRAAYDILQRVEHEDAYSSVLLAAADDGLDSRDLALCHELVLGVLRQRLWLDRCIEHFGGRPLRKIDPPVVRALRLGLYQLRFLSRIPPSAAVNESVNLIRAAKLGSAAGFANAVLRRATREADYHPAAEIEDPIEALAVETSHPPWLVERWIEQVGFAETRALARANNDAAPTAFRFTAKTGQQAEAIIDELRAQGAEVRPAPVARNGWRVSRADNEGAGSNIRAVPAPARVLLRKLSAEGLIYFQDEGSQLVAELLRAQSDERVLEVCAAPGSKATLIAALARQATVVAGDIYEHRARTIKEFATQQQAGNVWPVVYDATRPLPFPADSFDRVLVDAPCSGTGTLRHNPEIRWRLQPADIAELAGKQKSILGNAAAMVREGGALVYSTCSLETEENEAVILDFCETHPDFENAPSDGEGGAIWLTDTGAVRTWPHKDEVDGFFVTVLRRKS